jgi:hypothetical protein
LNKGITGLRKIKDKWCVTKFLADDEERTDNTGATNPKIIDPRTKQQLSLQALCRL